jgi:hypothetical protein
LIRLSRHDRVAFEALLNGEHALHSFGHRDLSHKLMLTPLAADAPTVRSPRFHTHVAWRVCLSDRRIMGAGPEAMRKSLYPVFAPRLLDGDPCKTRRRYGEELSFRIEARSPSSRNTVGVATKCRKNRCEIHEKLAAITHCVTFSSSNVLAREMLS